MKNETIEFTEEAVKKYLDDAITYWRKLRDSGSPSSPHYIVYYIDAYQSVRVSLFGELKPPESAESV